MTASGALTGASAWVLTDGKAGDLMQCIGLAEQLGLDAERRIIRPRAPWSWFAPFGPTDPREAPGYPGGPLGGPFPDIAIATGRRTVPSLRALKLMSGRRTFTVFLKDPRTYRWTADVVWVPEHDRLRGRNVIVTLTSPSRISPARLAAARAAPDPRLAHLPHPRVAMILGGPGARYCYDDAVVTAILGIARQGVADGWGLMITPSRRTPPALMNRLDALTRSLDPAGRLYIWRGEEPNPYLAMLALADAVIVTADSANMLGEAAATGAPVHVIAPRGGHAKMEGFVDRLIGQGAVRRWSGRLERFSYAPIDATPAIAQEIAARYAAFRAALP